MKDYIWVVEVKFDWEDDFSPYHLVDTYGKPLTRDAARSLARSEREWGGLENVRVRKYVRA